MAVKRGYKQTEVGVIPEEWETLSLANCCNKIVVGFVGTCEPFYTSESKGVLLLRTGNLHDEKLSLEDVKYVTPEFHARNRKSTVRTGDILIARHGRSGSAVLVPDSVDDVNALNIVIIRTAESRILNRFAAYYVNSSVVQAQASERSAGSTQVVINTREVAQLLVAVPPLPEQRAIAAALSDVDALIASLDRLIAKKRDLKQAAMQQLLTGQTRLPGFGGKSGHKQTEVGRIPGDWEVRALKGIVAIAHGFPFASEYFCSHSPYRLTTPGHFHEEGGFRDIGEKQKFYCGPVPSDYVLLPGDLIVAMTEQADGLLGSAATIPSVNGYLHNQRLGRVKSLSPLIDLDFLRNTFNSKEYRAKVRETAAGTKVKHTSPEKLLDIPVRLPPLPEQRAIAAALSDMDAELTALEQRRDKTKLLKQGMMQELLTGRTRLV